MSQFMPDILYYINFFIIFAAIIYILLANKESESSLAWILIIIVLPFLGIILYALFGLDRKKHRIVAYRPEEVYEESLRELFKTQKNISGRKEVPGSPVFKNIKLLLKTSQAAITTNNKAELFFRGDELFDRLMEDLENAKESIHMEYFIWKSDKIGCRIKDILVSKARQGLDVKLIFDGLGAFGRISFKYKKELKEAGIRFSYFKDLNRFVARLKINYSNHKKIVVIDGKTAYTGGMNVGDEYIDGGRRFASWRDTHIRLEGNGVNILQSIFLADWANCGHDLLTDKHFFPIQEKQERELPLQIAISGPDSKWNTIELLLFNMINNAASCIYIQSPYFIPDSAMMRAMEAAAMSGVSVTFMMTGIPDKKIPWWTAFTNFEPLLKAGVRVLHYQAGFLHAKTAIMDDTISTVGTCNMDIRSFRLNYEVNAVFYDEKITRELKEQFLIDEKNCREITLEEVKNMGSPAKLRNSFCRLFSPLL